MKLLLIDFYPGLGLCKVLKMVLARFSCLLTLHISLSNKHRKVRGPFEASLASGPPKQVVKHNASKFEAFFHVLHRPLIKFVVTPTMTSVDASRRRRFFTMDETPRMLEVSTLNIC